MLFYIYKCKCQIYKCGNIQISGTNGTPYLTRNLHIYERSKTKKKRACILWAAKPGPCTVHYRPRHKYDAILNTFLSQLLVSKPHTKSSSTLDYMNMI